MAFFFPVLNTNLELITKLYKLDITLASIVDTTILYFMELGSIFMNIANKTISKTNELIAETIYLTKSL